MTDTSDERTDRNETFLLRKSVGREPEGRDVVKRSHDFRHMFIAALQGQGIDADPAESAVRLLHTHDDVPLQHAGAERDHRWMFVAGERRAVLAHCPPARIDRAPPAHLFAGQAEDGLGGFVRRRDASRRVLHHDSFNHDREHRGEALGRGLRYVAGRRKVDLCAPGFQLIDNLTREQVEHRELLFRRLTRHVVDRTERAEHEAVRRAQRHAGVEPYAGVTRDDGVVREPRICVRIRNDKALFIRDDMAAE